jgi:hypothetical protein
MSMVGHHAIGTAVRDPAQNLQLLLVQRFAVRHFKPELRWIPSCGILRDRFPVKGARVQRAPAWLSVKWTPGESQVLPVQLRLDESKPAKTLGKGRLALKGLRQAYGLLVQVRLVCGLGAL